MTGLAGIVDVVARGAIAVGGLCLICAVGLAAVLGVDERFGRNLLVRTPVTPCGDLLGAGRLPRVAAVYGRAAAGPGGPLTTPLSGRPCVWYRIQLWHEYSDGEGTYHRMLSAHPVAATVALDDGSGVVHVDAVLLDRPLPGSSASPLRSVWPGEAVLPGHIAQPDRSGITTLRERGIIHPDTATRPSSAPIWVVEEFIAPGRRILALGSPRRVNDSVILGRRPTGRSGVSAQPITAVRGSATRTDRETWSLVRGFGVFAAVLLGAGTVAHWLAAVSQ